MSSVWAIIGWAWKNQREYSLARWKPLQREEEPTAVEEELVPMTEEDDNAKTSFLLEGRIKGVDPSLGTLYYHNASDRPKGVREYIAVVHIYRLIGSKGQWG